MNYIGSKFSLLDFLEDSIKSVNSNLSNKVFCDIFAGTCIVGRHFKTQVRQVIANDLEFYSFVLAKNYIVNHTEIRSTKELFDELNDEKKTPLIKGKIYENYSFGGSGNRGYFSDENGAKIDAIRQKIETWLDNKKIDKKAYFHLLASLLESSDKVANTASVYGAFLKKLKKSASKRLVLEPAFFELNDNEHLAFNENANELIKKIDGDILYLDPPYNHREYGANYHLLNTIALYDDCKLKGKTGLREYTKSAWCKKNSAALVLDDLLKFAKFRQIFLSYNNEGIISPEEIRKIMLKYGKYECFTKEYRRFKADSKREQKASNVVEYLHFLEKDS
ncbi:D12 class N6 adenine-specific DNA methyltransferase superfamily protein [Campylobacter hyointestinalis subsp. hyointestinalis]|uniref:site-specific DNA-methyltransferase (adenine-specific) n=1 Tax=Campylobacter hyointestinalis subsp. hyointestinalis TaxID=91352 RepID=A0A9W5EYU4_CAMHY|nr:DNA adenine methylase [Campylobacter hyointestinalis]CUU71284.1 D12 class N6 adenine-specific DNA methyltransferase superfamily protein [Campylobacter hyointestinalis subsp. hyointestinalis]CUU71300.1 D12 class N6 adenine-specific DNA methyltransferase superfamily protein [Campylobacter hyointestinalis subsp. hyointestinalis]CUU85348.1 D12 class N6 adenine-specific DNA methyltransferase superfamily protein [Campylobacter hyointestinalis subsp. hyointestinalis]